MGIMYMIGIIWLVLHDYEEHKRCCLPVKIWSPMPCKVQTGIIDVVALCWRYAPLWLTFMGLNYELDHSITNFTHLTCTRHANTWCSSIVKSCQVSPGIQHTTCYVTVWYSFVYLLFTPYSCIWSIHDFRSWD